MPIILTKAGRNEVLTLERRGKYDSADSNYCWICGREIRPNHSQIIEGSKTGYLIVTHKLCWASRNER